MHDTMHRATASDGTRRRSTIRLGLVVSLVAAVLVIVVEAVVPLPAIVVLVPVVVVGFALSWHASAPPRR